MFIIQALLWTIVGFAAGVGIFIFMLLLFNPMFWLLLVVAVILMLIFGLSEP